MDPSEIGMKKVQDGMVFCMPQAERSNPEDELEEKQSRRRKHNGARL